MWLLTDVCFILIDQQEPGQGEEMRRPRSHWRSAISVQSFHLHTHTHTLEQLTANMKSGAHLFGRVFSTLIYYIGLNLSVV